MKKRIAAAVLIALCIAALFFLFRRRTEIDAAMGEVTYVWRWGIASHMKADRNRDGRIDLIATWNEGLAFYSDVPPRHLRADTNYDGTFDLRVTYYPERVVELDRNFDGVMETTLRGEEAEEYVAGMRLSR